MSRGQCRLHIGLPLQRPHRPHVVAVVTGSDLSFDQSGHCHCRSELLRKHQMRLSWTMEMNCMAVHFLPFQENADRHHDYRERNLAPALPLWKNSWVILVKLKRKLLLCC